MNEQKIKEIFEREIKRHIEGIKEHKELVRNKSKKQRDKQMKHFHKLFQTKLLAEQIGLKFCDCCGVLR